jgi:hypothetical protein
MLWNEQSKMTLLTHDCLIDIWYESQKERKNGVYSKDVDLFLPNRYSINGHLRIPG